MGAVDAVTTMVAKEENVKNAQVPSKHVMYGIRLRASFGHD